MKLQEDEKNLLSLEASLTAVVARDLHVSLRELVFKISGIHFLSSALVLSLCQQFGVKIPTGINFMHAFMSMGHLPCQVLCGVLFMGASFLAMSLFLKRPELTWLRGHQVSVLFLCAGVSWAFLLSMSSTFSLFLSLAWILGASLGGVGALRLGYSLRV